MNQSNNSKTLIRRVLDIYVDEGITGQLKRAYENNSTHLNESVYDHTLNLLKRFEKYLNMLDGSPIAKEILQSRVDQDWRRGDLLLVSVLFHDIGKIGYGNDRIGAISDDGRATHAPDHEKASCWYFEDMQNKYSLFSSQSYMYLMYLIRNHSGWPNHTFEHHVHRYSQEEMVNIFSKNPISFEILIYQLLENRHVEKFEFVARVINKLLNNDDFLQKILNQHSKFISMLNNQLDTDQEIALLTNINSNPWGEVERSFHLVEEVGELCDVLMKVRGLKDDKEEKEHLIGALSDVYRDFLGVVEDNDISRRDVEAKCLSRLKPEKGE